MESMDIDFQPSIDLQLYSCKFYSKDIEGKHTYLLLIPGQKDGTTFRINFDRYAVPNEDTVKQWTSQPWYHPTVIEKYHMIHPTDKLPESKKIPLKDSGKGGFRTEESYPCEYDAQYREKTRKEGQKNDKKTEG